MSRTGGPRLPDIQTQIQAGINPKTGLPLRCDSGVNLFESTRIFMRLIDEQDAVNRYVWYNLPDGITGQELERMLYYKGQLCFFYFKELDKICKKHFSTYERVTDKA